MFSAFFHKRVRLTAFWLSLLTLGVLAVACSGGATPTESPGPTPGATEPATALPAATSTAPGSGSGSGATTVFTSSGQAKSPGTVNVVEKNYTITVDKDVASPGQITFQLTNQGPSEHEFVIFKTDLAPDNLPTKNGLVDESASALQKITEQQQYPSGETRTLTAQLDAGNYVLICNLPGHYLQGMRVGFTVTPNPGPTLTAESTRAAQATATVTPTASESAGAGETVHVIEKNYDIFVDRDAVAAGTVAFDLRNEGVSVHEFVIFKTDLPAGQLPVKDAQVVEDSSQLQKITEQKEFPPGETRTLTAQLEPGHYVLICNLPDHFGQGMRIDFSVTGPGGTVPTAEGGQATPTPAPQGAETTVKVIEENYAILLNDSSVPAGSVTFDLKNEGPDEHEFVIFKTDLASGNLPVQDGQVVEDSPQLQKVEEREKFPSGQTSTLAVDLAPGHYVLICNLPGHYQQGMHFGLTVTGAASGGGQAQVTATPQPAQTIQVVEENYAILVSHSSALSGTIAFHLTNQGPDDHEFVIFKTDLAAGDLPVQDGQVVEDSPQLQKIDEQEKFPAGESRTLTLDLAPGHYVLICNLPGHYQQGMYFGFTLKIS